MLATVHQPLSHSAALAVLADQLGQLDMQLQEELAHCGVLSVRLDREAEIWVGIDQATKAAASFSSFKVLVVMEPAEVRRLNVEGFDLILTWHKEHLATLPQARLFVPATPWLLPAEWLQFHGAKKPGLGFLRGSKRRTEGHQLRHAVWDAREQLSQSCPVPVNFIAGGVSRDERNQQFVNQFVLVIENSRHENYFTEKLLDAMLARCIPIYWGCKNLGDFFDVHGVIEVSGGVSEVLEACCGLQQGDYDSRHGALEANLKRASRYAGDFGKRLQCELEGHLPSFEKLS